MSAVAKVYGHICVALDTHPKLQSFLTDQVVEWGRISVDRLDVSRLDNDSSALLDVAVLPLPDGKGLSLPEKAMVLVAIYNLQRPVPRPKSNRPLAAKITRDQTPRTVEVTH